MPRAIQLTLESDDQMKAMENELGIDAKTIINNAMALFARAYEAAKRGNFMAEVDENASEVFIIRPEVLESLYARPPKPGGFHLKLVPKPDND